MMRRIEVTPEIGMWYAEGSEHGLLQLQTENDVQELTALLSEDWYHSLCVGVWRTKDEASADLRSRNLGLYESIDKTAS